jgi:hypothetical protein
MTRNGRAALVYAQELKFPVFPCKPGDKVPLSPHGLKDATTDPHLIGIWWRNWPDANIGIPTGSISGFDVLDVDEGGDDTLDELETQNGKLPNTVEALTGGGGRHMLFRHRDGVRNSVRNIPGIDVRGEGGYIIAAPSVHKSGREYAWELSSRPGEAEIAEWPEWLLDRIRQGNGVVAKPGAPVAGNIAEGKRNATLTSLAGTMRRKGMTEEAIAAALLAENATACKPPMDDDEVRKIAASIIRYEPSERPFGTSVTPGGGRLAEGEWPDPVPLPDALPPVEPFVPALLPDAFRAWIEDISDRMQCPPDFPAVGAMVALSAVVGRQIAIRPKRRDDWAVVPNLWGGVVGRSGIMKSPAVAETLKPLHALEVQAREEHQDSLQDYEAAKLVAEAEKRHAQDEIKKAIKEQRDPMALAKEIANQEASEPARRRYLVNDTTVEKLGEILNANPRGVLLFRDELTGFLRMLDREGCEGSRAFYLEAWNGAGGFTFDRIGRGTIDIEAACVSILGGIQPGPLSAYMRRVAEGGGDDDGLVQRFQLVVWPDVPTAWIDRDTPPNPDARGRAYSVFERLDHIETQTMGAESTNRVGESPFLRFFPEAQEIFTEWRTELEHRIRKGDESPMIVSHLSKYRSLIPSLALLIHLADVGAGPVGEGALQRACAWGEYLESHARRVYAPMISPAAGSGRVLAQKILQGELDSTFTLRDVYRKHWQGLSTKGEAEEAVNLLDAYDWGRRAKEATGGRSTVVFYVNPKVAMEKSDG